MDRAKPEPPLLNFAEVLTACDIGNAVTRREMLTNLFDALDIENGEIAAFLPRSDWFNQVRVLMGRVVTAEREGFEPSIHVTADTDFPGRRPRPTRRSLRARL